jgi:hypothetical protein
MHEKQENSANLSPLSSFVYYVDSRVRGRVRYPRSRKGEAIKTRRGNCRVLKEIALECPGEKAPGAIFMVRFHLKSMSPRLNALFLNLPVPFIAGLPGFHTKLWMFNDATGEFQGLYEWSTTDDARAYAGSFAAKFMKRRSIPGSAECAIVDKTTGAEVAHGKL